MTAVRDRVAGVLLGQAAGDALGVPYEFGSAPLAPGEAPRMIGGGLGPYAPGEWSDDTQMALVIARAAAEHDLTSPEGLDTVATGFEDWLTGGATDVGMQTRAVLMAARRYPGTPGERLTAAAADHLAHHGKAAGNGALMRTAVVALQFLEDREGAARAAAAVARLTHADPLAVESSVLWAEAVRVAVAEQRLDVRAGIDLLPKERREYWEAVIDEAEEPGESMRFRPNGFTVTAFQAAWHAICSVPIGETRAAADQPGGRDHLEAALAAAIHIGDDTDTVAAIAGSLLGAYWGAGAVRPEWRDALNGWPGLDADGLTRLALAIAGLE